MKTRIHVNQHIIKRNRETGEREPALSVKRGGRTYPAHRVTIHGGSVVMYSPDKPLSCGATAWVETDAPVTIATSA